MIYHTIYKTNNLINGKYYIGKHSTTDPYDSYLGSGKNISDAIKKYGKKSFKKEVLYIFEKQEDAFLKEEEIVNSGVLEDPLCYNLCLGGMGGNLSQRKNRSYEEIYGVRGKEIAEKISKSKIAEKNPMFGKKHSIEARQKISKAGQLKQITAEQRKKAMSTRKARCDAGEIIFGMTGKKHSEESKKKTSNTLTGQRWWNDGQGNRKRATNCPGDGWILGSGKKNAF